MKGVPGLANAPFGFLPEGLTFATCNVRCLICNLYDCGMNYCKGHTIDELEEAYS